MGSSGHLEKYEFLREKPTQEVVELGLMFKVI